MHIRSILAAAPLAGLVFGLAGGVQAASAPAFANGKAPATRRDTVTATYYGIKVADPYRWLEASGSREVKQWIAAQNAWADRVLSSFPQGGAMARRVKALSLTSPRRSDPQLVAGKLFFMQLTPPEAQAELRVHAWPDGKAKTLANPNTMKGVAITGYWPSPDGTYVVYGTAKGGNEATTLHVVDVAIGKTLAAALPHAGGGTTPQGVVWDADGKGFLYVRLPNPDSQFNAVLYHHELGTPAAEDTLAFGRGFSPVAEYDFASSSDGKNAAIMVHYGDGNPDYVYLRTARSWNRVLGPAANIRAATWNHEAAWLGSRFLVISCEDAPRGKLVAVTPDGKVETLVPQVRGDWAMSGVAPVRGGVLVTEVSGPDWRVAQYDANGKFVRFLPVPEKGIGIGAIASTDRSDTALVTWSGWKIPSRWARYDTGTGKLKTVFEVRPAADYSKLVAYRLTATSKDGTKVPVTVVAMKGTKPDGKRPAILYAYGGFGITVAPHFMGPYLAWLEHGGIYALANIRGGGAYGEGWHEDGMLGKKQNDFNDFYAAAQALVNNHWTDSAHLGILGGSNGGLLMGAALTQHPGEYRAVVSLVGIYDMLRWELWPNGRYNISEYGTVTKKKDFEWLYAYSPLQHVKKGTAYPAVLLITGVNDPRVAPWQSRKFAAALQYATSSDRPILLLTRMNEGHGVTASFSQRLGNTTAALVFFAHELGLELKPQPESEVHK